MKKLFRLMSVATFALAALVFARAGFAQNPLEVGPDIYSLVFENDRVRVMQVTFKPGDKIAMHSHPDHVTTFLTEGTLRLFYPDGSSKDISGKPGDSVWIPAEAHAAENIGTTEVRGIVIELKEPKAELAQ
jgi:quercetin dioxygenase-like cupin family protein